MIENTLTTILLSQAPVLPSVGGTFQAGDVTFKVMWVEEVGIPLVESAWTNPRDVEYMHDWGAVEHNPLYVLWEKDAARHHQVMQQLSGRLMIDPRVSQAFQLDLQHFLGVPVRLAGHAYHEHLCDSIAFPGHQSPEHRRCRTVRYLSEPLCATDLLTANDMKAEADAILERLKPEVRKLIEGVTELHSAEWGLTCMPDRRENPQGDLFHFFVKMYIDIGEAYTARDKPGAESLEHFEKALTTPAAASLTVDEWVARHVPTSPLCHTPPNISASA